METMKPIQMRTRSRMKEMKWRDATKRYTDLKTNKRKKRRKKIGSTNAKATIRKRWNCWKTIESTKLNDYISYKIEMKRNKTTRELLVVYMCTLLTHTQFLLAHFICSFTFSIYFTFFCIVFSIQFISMNAEMSIIE